MHVFPTVLGAVQVQCVGPTAQSDFCSATPDDLRDPLEEKMELRVK